jgi:hypothetical protein
MLSSLVPPNSNRETHRRLWTNQTYSGRPHHPVLPHMRERLVDTWNFFPAADCGLAWRLLAAAAAFSPPNQLRWPPITPRGPEIFGKVLGRWWYYCILWSASLRMHGNVRGVANANERDRRYVRAYACAVCGHCRWPHAWADLALCPGIPGHTLHFVRKISS